MIREKPFTPNEVQNEVDDIKLKLEKYVMHNGSRVDMSPTLHSEIYHFLCQLSYWGVQNEPQTTGETEAREEASETPAQGG